MILLMGNRLRSFSYATVPHPGEVTDEYAYGWLGLNLIKEKYPISWSSLSSYKSVSLEKINVDSLYDKNPAIPPFPIVKPFFDHPPLFGLITGGYAYLKGARSMVETSVSLLRRPMLKIALLTTILIYLLGTRFYGWKVGLLASLLYSIIPTAVISSRLALMENGLIPLFLGSLLLADFYFTTKKKIYWYLAGLCVFIAVLFKLSGVSLALTLILAALYFGKKNKRFLITTVLISTILPLILFIVYGAFFDWQVFLATFVKNSQRFYGAGAEIFLQAVAQSRLTTYRFLTDGWILFGWISLFLLAFSERKKTKGGTLIYFSVISYLTVFLLFGSESYGWYKFPFYPFLILAIARLVQKLFEKPNLFVFFSLILLPLGSTVHRLIGVEGFQQYVVYLRIFSVFFFSLFALTLVVKNKIIINIQRLLFLLTLIFLIWLSIKEIFYYTLDKWFFVT
jgi:4-amino-4-deoxy-L-arabinose transferase-like glycosyltransferase